jgi:ATP-dependent DNA helicase RecG
VPENFDEPLTEVRLFGELCVDDDRASVHHESVLSAAATLAPGLVSPSQADAPGSELPRAFASNRPLGLAELLAAPVRWPRPSRLREPLKAPARKAADGLGSLGLHTVGDLLEHLPRDLREARTVAALRPGEQATVAVQVRAIAARAVRRRKMRPLVEASVFDETGSMYAVFFNQPWLVEKYPPGTRLLLHGKAGSGGRFSVAHHAVGGELGAAELAGADGSAGVAPGGGAGAQTGVAHYPAAEGVTSTQILTLVQGARAALADVLEPLPARLRAAEGLPDRPAALAAMHFPGDPHEAEAGRIRLAFEELLLTQLVFLRRRERRRAHAGAPVLDQEPSLSAHWLAHALPFTLTGEQREAIAAIAADLASPHPMQRLLMGEVGSGKTVVALHAMLRAVEHGRQAALMAPTETLAEQHFATVQRLLGEEAARVPMALLTGSTPARRRADALGKLSSGELSILVGTHALIEPDVRFRALAVAVVDEQHRFGVRQRTALEDKQPGQPPHVLHMTATPIPRTLALTEHGDLDVTVLRELPGGRRPIRTRIVAGESARARAYEHLREQLRAGRQAYVVCPLVEESEPADASRGDAGGSGGPPSVAGTDTVQAGPAVAGAGEMRAASAEVERLAKGELKGHRLLLLHGQMRPREKQQAMAEFASGAADVLVATTVIEVGVDVPNATVMLVENAERFGISQLHQLRGRIGRGEHPSTCLLCGPPGALRLRALAEHSDGFRLAEIDLELRSEGELVGTRQSGLGQFKVACLPQDAALLERARAQAQAIVARDPELAAPEHALLGQALAQAFGDEALAPIPA